MAYRLPSFRWRLAEITARTAARAHEPAREIWRNMKKVIEQAQAAWHIDNRCAPLQATDNGGGHLFGSERRNEVGQTRQA